MPPIDWGTINTALILALGGYLWKQSGKVDRIYQSLFGVDGQQGLVKRVDVIEAVANTVDERITETRHTLRNEYQVALLQLHDDIDKRLNREQGRP